MKNQILHKRISYLFLFVFSLFMIPSCVSDNGEEQSKQSTTNLSSVKGSVIDDPKPEKGSAKTIYPTQDAFQLDCDQVSQCKAIGISPSACGGFSSYLVYSSKTEDNNILIKRINILNQQQSLEIKKKGIVGICVHIAKPIVSCQQNTCGVQASANEKALY